MANTRKPPKAIHQAVEARRVARATAGGPLHPKEPLSSRRANYANYTSRVSVRNAKTALSTTTGRVGPLLLAPAIEATSAFPYTGTPSLRAMQCQPFHLRRGLKVRPLMVKTAKPKLTLDMLAWEI